MQAAQNESIARIGPDTPCGELMRRYRQPVALLDESNPRFGPRMAGRPIKAVRLLGQDLVLFRRGDTDCGAALDDAPAFGLLDRHCPHRGADLAFARHEPGGIRCPFHGWKFAADGRSLETPAEPTGSTLCTRVRQLSYPVLVRAGVIFAYPGPESGPGSMPPALPAFDAFTAPATHRFAFEGLWHCNWLQAFEVGIDSAHPSFLHRCLQDESLEPEDRKSFGRQFRAASVGAVDGARWPLPRVMREVCHPDNPHEEVLPRLTRQTTFRPVD
ncbi:MAG: Rieske 2Fe-2S domain-containing protein, partial [Rubrivivax sp.]|nr:Rieske 2Fe-2S domain-containing protein [Rubrivivax sp.]